MAKRMRFFVAGMMVVSGGRMKAQSLNPPLASELAKHFVPGAQRGDVVFVERPADLVKDASLQSLLAERQELYPRAALLHEQTEYLQELQVRDAIAGYDLLLRNAGEEDRDGRAASSVLNQLAMEMDGAGRHEDAVSVLRLALQIQQKSPMLYTQQTVFASHLELAHALAQGGRAEDAATECAASAEVRQSRSDARSRGVLAGRQKLFCGDVEAGMTQLQAEMRAHPHSREVHHVLCDYATVQGRWADADAERRAWLSVN